MVPSAAVRPSTAAGGYMPTVEEEQRAAREIFCRLLSACYYEPGPEFAEEKLFDSMLKVAEHIDAETAACAQRLGEAFFAEEAESLLVDYTRLFLGPNGMLAKPYGSAWLERESGLMQDSTMAVQELYEEGGFDLDEDFHELPDHIAVELEFLYLLMHDENEALRAGDAAELQRVRDLRNRFFHSHLGAWAGEFTAAVAAGTRSAFYRELAGLTERFVTLEKRALSG